MVSCGILIAAVCLWMAGTMETGPEPDRDTMVCVRDYIPDIEIDLKYGTTDNFTGQKIYDFTEAYLRYGTVEKLVKAQEHLKEQGLV